MDHRWPPVELRIETYERLPPVVTGDTPVVTGGLRWVSSTGTFLKQKVLIEKCDQVFSSLCSSWVGCRVRHRLLQTHLKIFDWRDYVNNASKQVRTE